MTTEARAAKALHNYGLCVEIPSREGAHDDGVATCHRVAAALSAAGCLRDDREGDCTCSLDSFAANQWYHFPDCPREGREGETVMEWLHVRRADGMDLCEYDDEDWPCEAERARVTPDGGEERPVWCNEHMEPYCPRHKQGGDQS